MRLSSKTIKFVKIHASMEHNPETMVTVMLRNRELRHYNIYNIPKAVKEFCESTEWEAWYKHSPELLTWVWMSK